MELLLENVLAGEEARRVDSRLPRQTRTFGNLDRRYAQPPSTTTLPPPSCLEDNNCSLLPRNYISLPRTTFILVLTLLITLTLTSTLGLAILLYRRHARRRQSQQAKTWGRKSRYLNRISVARKQLDDDFRRQYHGVFVNVVENPELGSDSPVELGWEERVWEMPNVETKREKRLPPLPEIPESVRVREGLGNGVPGANGRGGGRKSLFFCDGVGVWLPKR